MTTQNALPSAEEFDRLENELFSRITTRHRRQILRHRLVAVAAVMVVAGAGIAAGTVANPTAQRNSATCYSADSLSSQSSDAAGANNLDVGSKPGVRPDAAKVARVVAVCESLWQGGVFGSASTSAPRLQACLQDNLVIAVFPKKGGESAASFCDNLGLGAP